MYKLIGLIVAVLPVVLFLRALFPGRSKKRSQAMSDLRKRVDYLVWVMLFLIGCEVAYTVGSLILN
jgi:hypothetical protein